MNKVVRCKNDKCVQHFMYTKENTKCPFCHTEYGEVEEKPKEKEEVVSAEEKSKEKKGTIKNRKESFKIWKDN